jgi:hypothetical protein
MADLWPDDFGVLGVTPPNTILREQAAALSKRTRGLVEGEVHTRPEGSAGGEFIHSLYLVVPLMENYTYRLLYVRSPLQLYPLELHVEHTGRIINCPNPDEFIARLKEVFAAEDTKSIIRGLMAQVEDIRPAPREPAAQAEASPARQGA